MGISVQPADLVGDVIAYATISEVSEINLSDFTISDLEGAKRESIWEELQNCLSGAIPTFQTITLMKTMWLSSQGVEEQYLVKP